MFVRAGALLVVASAACLALLGPATAQEQPPPAPAELVAIPIADATGVSLRWAAADGAQRYVIERSSQGPAGPWQVIASTEQTEYHDFSGLEPGATYWYRVAAEGASGTSDYSNILEAEAGFPFPLPVTPSPTQIILPPTGSGSGGDATTPYVLIGVVLTLAAWTFAVLSTRTRT